MYTYRLDRVGAFNDSKLNTELSAANSNVFGFSAEVNETGAVIIAMSNAELTAPQVDALQAVVTNHNPTLTAAQIEAQQIEEARAAIVMIRRYRQQQLVKETPDTPAQQVTTIKNIANGNVYLARIMTNKISEKNSAHGWSLTLNPGNLQTRHQFIDVIDAILGMLP
jgi:hypothetical protein